MSGDNGHHEIDGLVRDIAFERRWTSEAAAVAHTDAERLNDFAEQRAGRGPVLDLDKRNFGKELREELADARNYAVWWALQIVRADSPDPDGLGGEITEQVGQALSAIAVAFEHADRARGLQIEWRGAHRG